MVTRVCAAGCFVYRLVDRRVGRGGLHLGVLRCRPSRPRLGQRLLGSKCLPFAVRDGPVRQRRLRAHESRMTPAAFDEEEHSALTSAVPAVRSGTCRRVRHVQTGILYATLNDFGRRDGTLVGFAPFDAPFASPFASPFLPAFLAHAMMCALYMDT